MRIRLGRVALQDVRLARLHGDLDADNLVLVSAEEHRRIDAGMTADFDQLGLTIHEDEDRLIQLPAFPGSRKEKRMRARMARSRSLLAAANRLLPEEDREEVLDEWVDDIEAAAEGGLPVRRRAIWIVVRSVPVILLRSRLPNRARGGQS